MRRQSGIAVRQSLLHLMTGLASSLLLMAGLMYLVERSGSKVNLSLVFESLKAISLEVLLLYTLVVVANTLARAVRYRLLVDARIGASKTRFTPLLVVTAVRNMVVDLLPARIGELVFVAMLKRACATPAATGLAAVALSLLLDIVVLIPLLVLVALVPLTGPALREGSFPAALLLIILSVVAVVVLWPGLRALVRWSRNRNADRSWMRRPVSLLSDISDALIQCQSVGILGRALGMTVVIRLLKYGGLLLLFYSVTSSPGMEVVAASVADVVVALVASEVGASVPVPTLMSFGAYEAGGAAALLLLGYPLAAAVMVLLTVHIASQVLDYVIGGICLVLFFLIRTDSAGYQKHNSDTLPAPSGWRWGYVGLAAMALVLAAGLFVYQLDRVHLARSQVAPPPNGLPVKVSDGSASAPTGISGWVVWSSNRYGNHDILKIRLEDRRISRLTDHPHTETFPRISPSGSEIVFMRSREPWVSLRDPVNWDTYLLNLESGRERLLAEYAGAPSWSADGQHIYFQRRGSAFVEYELSSGKERVLFRAGTGGIPAGVELQTPSFNATSEGLASTWRGVQRKTGINYSNGTVISIGGGCQLTWSPEGQFVYWIGHGGLMENRLYRQIPGKGMAEPWLDLPTPYSHEYFPKLNQDGRYLVLGASAGGHEHDVADYEIFLWLVGAPADQALRLTFHSGNDNWPDIYTD
ncbi:MAG: hypothetical protein HN428_08155 [Proteobacteria bacterium]|nr:hypothetical protein [Pseudomonadota bacterium]